MNIIFYILNGKVKKKYPGWSKMNWLIIRLKVFGQYYLQYALPIIKQDAIWHHRMFCFI